MFSFLTPYIERAGYKWDTRMEADSLITHVTIE